MPLGAKTTQHLDEYAKRNPILFAIYWYISSGILKHVRLQLPPFKNKIL